MTLTALHAPASQSEVTRKAMLFCPNCEHANPIDGDWERTNGTDNVQYRCPACQSILVNQPVY